MTGPALTPREAAVIDEALDVLGQIEDPAFPAPADRDAYKAFAECAHGLRDAVELHEDIRTGLIHPARVYDDLAGGQDDALAQALELATGDIADWTAAMRLLIGQHCETRHAIQAMAA